VLHRLVVLIGALLVAALALVPCAHARPVDGASLDPCFGAAARDTPRPDCPSEALLRSVEPSPAEASKLPNSPCTRIRAEAGDPPVCWFGAPANGASRVVALVGDSHAGHWRAALTTVAQAKGWHGLSITHSSCPLQIALRDLPEPKRTSCRKWKRRVFAWFDRHPEVHTAFVAGLTGGTGVVPEGRLGPFRTSVRGYTRAWEALPATVQRIVVIRDTPKFRTITNACLERAVAAGRRTDRACWRARSEALDRDPAIVAAAAQPRPQVQTVDLTRYFCSRRHCFPVVGGALVLRDNTHVTGVFSATLGPYLLRAVDRLDLG
jgi:hypothetical protein